MTLPTGSDANGLGDDDEAPFTDADLKMLRMYRLSRVREALEKCDCAALVVFDPVNIRYTTDTRNMSLYTQRNPIRYAFIPTQGPVVMFEPAECRHLCDGFETVDEVRPATAWYYLVSGPNVQAKAARWAAEIADLVNTFGGGNRRLAIDRCDRFGVAELTRLGLTLHDGQVVMEDARVLKSREELKAIKDSVGACMAGVRAMREALRPGMTENELWSILHRENIAHGGEWIETRLLASGPRTNPWMRESSDRVMEAGDLVGLDTDLIGRHGYFADFSRTWLVGNGRPTDDQRRLYADAFEQLQHNLALLKPGLETREFAEKAWPLPDIYAVNRYADIGHGAGMSVEYPFIPYLTDFEESGYDAVIQENMVMCVESYVGALGGSQGVKLEQQVHITAAGAVPLSTYPFEEAFL